MLDQKLFKLCTKAFKNIRYKVKVKKDAHENLLNNLQSFSSPPFISRVKFN